MIHYYGKIFRTLYPDLVWRIDTAANELFLTFDDGPVPEATPFVLDTLEKYGAKATFFCVGDNIRKNPELFERITSSGNRVANHTYHHLNGWKTKNEKYLKDVALCNDSSNVPLALFRPPYGKMKRKQRKELVKNHKIVMWEVLAGDFKQEYSWQDCYDKTVKYSRPGSIVLFHDSIKTIDKLKKLLPAYLDYFSKKGFTFPHLPL